MGVKRTGEADPRVTAARLLGQLAEGRSLSELLPAGLDRVAPRDRALVQEFCFGVARWRPRLEAIAAHLMSKPIKPKEGEVQALILLGLYQLLFMRIKPHAAVAETVQAAHRLKKKWAVGLINALLRRFQREQAAILKSVDQSLPNRMAMPEWLLDRIQQDWPQHWEAILRALLEHPPMSLRVNLAATRRDDYLQRLTALGMEATVIPHTASGLCLSRPMDVLQLAGFIEGLVSVQDGGAQLAAPLLDLQPGQQVLDACAAPGGKSGHILESVPDVDLLAMDRDPERLSRVRENLNRLGVAAEVVEGDAAAPSGVWSQRHYDRILLDVPCSATGVIRRHPDIKLLRRADDIPPLVALQAQILDAVWPMLKKGGRLLYATCSLLREENDLQLERFLTRTGDARERKIEASWGQACRIGRQTLPGEATMDGFYYACLEKA